MDPTPAGPAEALVARAAPESPHFPGFRRRPDPGDGPRRPGPGRLLAYNPDTGPLAGPVPGAAPAAAIAPGGPEEAGARRGRRQSGLHPGYPQRRQGAPLAGLPHPVLDLETAILAGVAASEGLPFLGLRAITDGRGGGDSRLSPSPGPAATWAPGRPSMAGGRPPPDTDPVQALAPQRAGRGPAGAGPDDPAAFTCGRRAGASEPASSRRVGR